MRANSDNGRQGIISIHGMLLSIVAALALAVPAPAAARSGYPRIEVLSSRADLVAGGEAVVAVDLPRGVKPSRVRVKLGRRSITRMFAIRPNRRYEGLVTGLRLGRNVLTAVLPNGRGARIVITNHANGGPVFSGPQIKPWTCQPGARDRKCDAPRASPTSTSQPIPSRSTSSPTTRHTHRRTWR